MSEQFDVHRNLHARSPSDPPYLVNLQSDYLASLPTVIVAPLWETASDQQASLLATRVTLGSRAYIIAVAELTSMRRSLLGPVVANLGIARDRIVRALDLLFTGV